MVNFGGLIKELPNISIDGFGEKNNVSNLNSTCFFLSHCHTDHMSGLDTNFVVFLKNNPDYYLYCSPISCLILLNLNIGFEEDLIKVLDGPILINVPGKESTQTVSYNVTVTSIPAGHCPGSVMFLFETVNDIILYTGDFRIAKNDIRKFRQLKNYGNGNKTIDKIYLDATFLNEDYWEFPERSECIKDVTDIIRNWLQCNPKGHVNISTPAKYGYEDLLIELSKEFKCKIHVCPSLFNLFSNLPSIGQILTNDAYLTQIHCVPSCHIPCTRFLTIRPCAQRFTWQKGCTKPDVVIKESETYYAVCYATHSSCSEIIEFLQYLRPRCIQPLCDTYQIDEEETLFYIHKIRSLWSNYSASKRKNEDKPKKKTQNSPIKLKIVHQECKDTFC